MKSLLVSCSLLVCCLSHSAAFGGVEIKSRGLTYDYDGIATGMPSDGYITCDGCGDDRMIRSPKPITISFSEPEKTVESAGKHCDLAVNLQEKPCEKSSQQKASAANNNEVSLLGVVRFDLDSSKITKSEKEKLLSVHTDSPVKITGYTCTIGSDLYNKHLSQRRAKTVAKLLQGQGVRVASVEGKGKCCPVSSDKRINRRVEIESVAESTK